MLGWLCVAILVILAAIVIAVAFLGVEQGVVTVVHLIGRGIKFVADKIEDLLNRLNPKVRFVLGILFYVVVIVLIFIGAHSALHPKR